MMFGSPKFKLATSDFGHMLNVALYVGGSAAATKLIELLSSYDFGAYQVVVMAVLNLAAVFVKEYFSDTRVEVTTDDAGV